jgi:hypothetical protein
VSSKFAKTIGGAVLMIGGAVVSVYYPNIGVPMMMAGAGMVLSGAMQATSVGKTDPEAKSLDPGSKMNTRTTNAAIRVVYGTCRVAGNDVYIATSGTNSVYMWIVQTLAEGECDSIAQASGVDKVFLNDKLYNEYGGNVSYWFHSGSSTQSKDLNLFAEDSQWTDCLKNTCYIVFKLSYNTNYFQSFPARTVVLKGKKLYDFRDTTTKWSDNPALCLYDYLTNARYGLGISSSEIDLPTWSSAANYCDTKGWGLSLSIGDQDKSAKAVIDTICSYFRGHLIWNDGKYYLRYSDLSYESSVMAIEDKHIYQDESGKAQVTVNQPTRFQRPDAYRVFYTNSEKDYTVDHVIVGDTLGNVKELHMEGTTDRKHASDLGVYILEREQLSRSVSGVFRDECAKLEPHDPVTFTSTALGISAQLMRVESVEIAESGLVGLNLIYESTDLYDDDYDFNVESIYGTTLINPLDEPPSVANVSVTEEQYNYRLRTFTRLNVTFNFASTYPWLLHVEIWLSKDNATWEHLFNVTSNFIIDPVEEGVVYYLKFRTVNIFGVKRSDANSYVASIGVLGYTSLPESLTALYAVVNQNAINLYANAVDDPDIAVYEFRMGASWSGSVFLAAYASPNLSLTGVKPGSHTFWCNTKSNNGYYGATPRSAGGTLSDPPDGWTVNAGLTKTDDYK